jgi:hypothetical protein
MNVARLAVAVLSYLVACTHVPHVAKARTVTATCPSGFSNDPTRAQHLTSLLKSAGALEASELTEGSCFGPSLTLGVLAGGQPLLDVDALDEALAARMAHLHIHVRDKLGDGCAAGLTQALLSEEKAQEQERRLRTKFGLPIEPETQESRDARADYIQRCTR